MTTRTDETPAFTRAVLIIVIAITISCVSLIFFKLIDSGRQEEIAPLLWLFTSLFVVRVVGQMLVAMKSRRWLPPMGQWNLIPYPILLPTQLVIIVGMIWINLAFSMNFGVSTARNERIGYFLIVFSAIYASAMIIRYVVRMSRCLEQRWFGGTIPIVFHFVLASYLYFLGSFYAAG